MNALPTREGLRALTEGVAAVDRSGASRLRIGGAEAVDLLDRLSTNDLRGLATGRGASTVLTTNKGRIIDLLVVSDAGDHLLALGSAPAAARVMEWIDFYTFDEDVDVRDLAGRTFMTGLAGPGAADAVGRLAGGAAAALEPFGLARTRVAGLDATVVRSDFLGRAEFDVIVGSGDGPVLATALADVVPLVGPGAIEAARIERCVPAFGSELGEDRNPLEAGLIGSISFNKGCYVGQEVVARLNTYEKVQRRLAVLRCETGPVHAGEDVLAGGERVGVVTSAARHPEGGFVGLAYVRRAFDGGEAVVGPVGVAAAVSAPDPALSPAG